jgi:hypothetical protein
MTMKRKTPNTERRTSNAERGALTFRVAEEPDSGYTKKKTYDLEDPNLRRKCANDGATRDMNAPFQFDVRRSMFDVRCFPCL